MAGGARPLAKLMICCTCCLAAAAVAWSASTAAGASPSSCRTSQSSTACLSAAAAASAHAARSKGLSRSSADRNCRMGSCPAAAAAKAHRPASTGQAGRWVSNQDSTSRWPPSAAAMQQWLLQAQPCDLSHCTPARSPAPALADSNCACFLTRILGSTDPSMELKWCCSSHSGRSGLLADTLLWSFRCSADDCRQAVVEMTDRHCEVVCKVDAVWPKQKARSAHNGLPLLQCNQTAVS